VSQHALNLADAASRVGVRAGGGVTQVREADINDTLQGLRLAGALIKIGANARVILSSLENTMQSYEHSSCSAHPLAALLRHAQRRRL
jgi:hypothetical protein